VKLRPALVPALPALAAALLLTLAAAARAQGSSSSSSSSSSNQAPNAQQQQDDLNPINRPRAAQIERGGAAVTLETNEPLFQLAAALNACGYDADLDKSAPVRLKVRADMNAALAESEEARAARDKLCAYIDAHHQNDTGLDIGQYVSLALYLSPPPELTPNVSELDLPPQANAVINVLPLLRDFAEKIDLHFIWLRHRAEYEALTARVHDPMVQMLLTTNLYLHQPVSVYDGRRFLVLLEPMLSPNLTNARIYGSDYIVVMSPDNTPPTTAAGTAGVPVSMAQIRHIYLHYIVEPQVYSRGSAMERIQPLMRGVQDAPLEFFYKSDVVALISECLIKAIEARLYEPDLPRPKKPSAVKARADFDQYDADMVVYQRQTVLGQQRLVLSDMEHGWVLTQYFFDGLGKMMSNGDGLRDEVAPMIYGMDVERQRRIAMEIQWATDVQYDPLRPAQPPRKLEGMDLAELDLMQGKTAEAQDLAAQALADPAADHARATYVLARIELMQGDPEKSIAGFEQTLTLSKDPRTQAWSHIYLGRLYDIQDPPDRAKAIAEYKAALTVRDGRPDTRQAAEAGLAKPFALPQRARPQPVTSDDDKDFDPTGKAQKDAYKPPPPQ
jgi:tetratricopeptide (TPR) repeat protein